MVITVDVDRDTDQRLTKLAARTGKTKADHAAEIIRYKIDAYLEALGPTNTSDLDRPSV